MLVKAFVGTGVLFLPKAFSNGGIWFSTVLMVVVAALSLWSYMLLVKSRVAINGKGSSFGEIGGVLYGRYVRWLVQCSIALSQIGFSCAYTIFIAENLHAVIMSLSNCKINFSVAALIFMQIAVLVPFALIRRIERLGFATILAEVFILVGIIYILYADFSILAENGVSPDVRAFNPEGFALFIGTAVYSYEGIGLVIPIVEAMRNPKKFPIVLIITLVISTVLFVCVGAISYAAFGEKVQGMIVASLDQRNPIVQTIQILYALAILLSVPLQLFPAIVITENGAFGPNRSGALSQKWKWLKNAFRTGLVLLIAVISWAGSSELDKFVALIGNFACIPLCFIYPPLFHYRAAAKSRLARGLDLTLILIGLGVMIYGTYITVLSYGNASEATTGICNIE
jgi:proton-coupled amino acid transporter